MFLGFKNPRHPNEDTTAHTATGHRHRHTGGRGLDRDTIRRTQPRTRPQGRTGGHRPRPGIIRDYGQLTPAARAESSSLSLRPISASPTPIPTPHTATGHRHRRTGGRGLALAPRGHTGGHGHGHRTHKRPKTSPGTIRRTQPPPLHHGTAPATHTATGHTGGRGLALAP